MKIGLFFGTFNPIHTGHMIIANHLAQYADLEEVWLVITPRSPFKQKKTLLADHHRLAMVDLAVEAYPALKTTDIEFKLPQPNYTADTLAYIDEKYPQHTFCLIMGEDNLKGFHKWKNYEEILQQHSLYVYPRMSTNATVNQFSEHPKIHRIAAPIVQISATFIRKAIENKEDVRAMLPVSVWQYIDEMNFYK